MEGTFHRLRVQTFCYATESEELVSETFTRLICSEEFDCDISDGEHGNRTLILKKELTKQKEFVLFFENLGKDIADGIRNDIDNRIDDDCTFYLRLDKQDAVQGRWRIAHHGDVLSITGKLASHPARKEIAVANFLKFLDSLEFTDQSE